MDEARGSWRELLAGPSAAPTILLVGGVTLQAVEVFIGGTLLPTVVAEIGGLELFAWNTTLFIAASILASVFAALRPFGMGARGSYLLAAVCFGFGSLLCGLAPNIFVLLLGRAVQGFGAGLLAAVSYAIIPLVFEQRLWPRAMALISAAWGASTLVGPAIGGVFAELGQWRLAFLVLVPLSVLLAGGAWRLLPASSPPQREGAPPVVQVMLLVLAVLAVSMASVVTAQPGLAAGLVVLALGLLGALGLVERRPGVGLLPTGSFSLASPLAALFVLMLLMQATVSGDVFAPLFLQRLHGLSPLWAGYLVAALSAGWSTGTIVAAGWKERGRRSTLIAGPAAMLLGSLGLALFMGPGAPGGWLVVSILGVSLTLVGLGIGAAWQFVTPQVLALAPPGEDARTSAAISMVQLFASGLGAAVAGVIVNAGGLSDSASTAAAANAANWLYGAFLLLPLAALPIGWVLLRRLAPTGRPAPVAG